MNQTAALLILFTLLIIVLPVYIFWPFSLHVSTMSPAGSSIKSEIIINRSGEVVFQSHASSTYNVQLWKGTYSLLIHSHGFEPRIIHVSQPVSFSINEPVNLNLTLLPIMIPLTTLDFRDPTGILKRYPWLEIEGTTAWGEPFTQNLSVQDFIPIGTYIIRAADLLFNSTISFNVSYSEQQRYTILLEPNTNFDFYTVTQAEEAVLFLKEFARLFHTIPSQFYIHSNNLTLNSGDLLLLACQKDAAQRSKKTPHYYFLPHQHQYTIGQGQDCHQAGLTGVLIPESLSLIGLSNSTNLQKVITKNISPFPLAITFNLESGRYQHARGTDSLSPCHNETTRMGISPPQLVCNAPFIIPWFSPLDGPHSGQLPYPWATGYEGLQHIFTLPTRYGIPITIFAVNRDLLVLDAYDPTIKQTIQSLSVKGLIEIGSHTWNHRTLGTRPIPEEKDDIAASKAFLESYSGVSVTGFRAPFFSLLSNNIITHDDIIRDIGFSYTSGLPNQSMKHNLAVTSFLSSTLLDESILSKNNTQPFILSGHPYDFTHREVYLNKEVYLHRDPTQQDVSLATILFLIGNGGQPTTMHELAKQRGW